MASFTSVVMLSDVLSCVIASIRVLCGRCRTESRRVDRQQVGLHSDVLFQGKQSSKLQANVLHARICIDNVYASRMKPAVCLTVLTGRDAFSSVSGAHRRVEFEHYRAHEAAPSHN
ncbi:hypothetical protein BDW74DRAFT_68082 [Aspergillus multicolor]|uniref:uncharacterized protein n=1 Tax=Aspergillus multicolor TaxID=41759 RepID=UPI003CCD5155